MPGLISAETFQRYSLLTADEHYAMQSRAYREAAHCWHEYQVASVGRSSRSGDTLRAMLRESAESADAFYAEVTLALQARTRPEMIAR
jgi:hypothetical protein